MKRGYAGEHVPLLSAMLAGVAEDQGEGSSNPVEPNPIPIDPETKIPQSQSPTFINVADEATTTGYTSGSAEDSLQLKEFMVLVPKLVTRIDNLEKVLHHTKNTFGKAVLTLVERVKSLEVVLKKKTKKGVVSDSENEETENQERKIQDIDDDPLVSLVRESMEEKAADLITPTKISASGEVQEEDISPTTLEATKTLSEVVSQRARSTDNGKRYKRKTRTIHKDISTSLDAEVEVSPGRVIISFGSAGVNTGKSPMATEDVQDTKRTKEQIRQEEADLAEAMRKAEVQEVAQHYSEEDWDNIRAKLEANAELVKDVLGENVTSDDFAKRMVDMINQRKKYFAKQKAKARRNKPMTQAEQRTYMLKEEFEKLVRSIESLVPKDSEIEKTRVKRAGIELQKESSKKQKTIEQIKKRGKRKKQKARKGIHADKTAHAQDKERESFMKDKVIGASSESEIVPVAIKPPSIANWKIIKLELYKLVMQRYGTNGLEDEYERVFWGDIKTIVHCLNLELANIYMLIERRYPLPADVCQPMLSKKLQVDKKDEACYQLLKLIEKQAQNKLP
ncbi:hypothetical protein Tco_0287147 [Tanacetum coccineum]